MERVLIWDAESPHPAQDGTTVLWQRVYVDACQNVISIPGLVEEHADSLKARYLSFIYELGELRLQGRRLIDHLECYEGFSYWWMTLIAEGAYGKSPQIVHIIKMFAFTDWAAERSLSIKLVSANRLLAECIRLWCEKLGVPFEWQSLRNQSLHLSWIKTTYSALPPIIHALIWLIRYLVDRWPLRGVGLEEWRQTKGRITFVSYLLNLMPDTTKFERYKSQYWAHFPDELKKDGFKTNWLHLYSGDTELPNSTKAAQVIHGFNKKERGMQNHITLDAFLTLRIIQDTLGGWIKLLWTGRELQKIIPSALQADAYLWPLFLNDWRKSMCGVASISNLLYLNLFRAAVQSLPKQELGIYLQENQGWEFAFISEWRKMGHGRLVGAPHSTVRFWDLRYFFDSRSYLRAGSNQLPLPDQVALNGNAATDAYIAWGYPKDDIVQVEALRYLHLDSDENQHTCNSSSPKVDLRLLVLGDYLQSNTHIQLTLLEQAARLLPKNIAITVKPHPACPIKPEDYPTLRMTMTMEPVAKLLAESDIAYTSSVTSAAVDSYYTGVPVVLVLDGASLNLSPLRNFPNVFYASTRDELVSALYAALASTEKSLAKDIFFTIDAKLTRWKKIIT